VPQGLIESDEVALGWVIGRRLVAVCAHEGASTTCAPRRQPSCSRRVQVGMPCAKPLGGSRARSSSLH
jgi:hypothetical protein